MWRFRTEMRKGQVGAKHSRGDGADTRDGPQDRGAASQGFVGDLVVASDGYRHFRAVASRDYGAGPAL